MEATGNKNVSTLNFGTIVAIQNLSSKSRNFISPYPVANFLPCTLPQVSRGSARHIFLVGVFGVVTVVGVVGVVTVVAVIGVIAFGVVGIVSVVTVSGFVGVVIVVSVAGCC